MNLSKQIKKYREREQFSQEVLAEKLYVSRQTISNWENERSYPDIHNLLLMSVLFDVTLDELVKGDVEMMRKELDKQQWNKWTVLMILGMLGTILSIGPSIRYLGKLGLIIPVLFTVFMMYAAFKVEKLKKDLQLKTYSQIVAFYEGKTLSEKDVKKNARKDFWIKVALVIGFGIVGGVLAAISLLFA
ncbi:helix-turn-helix domain-containing protein [Enterococcus sp. AZ163]|uniref:helix-turn-helix domain-containing protein n=1 Tax=Enterococcus sp. AZ163 TaxID=2774638 RepID=UPI003D29E306